MTLPKQVTLVEVGPRDGLQNEPKIVDTAVKIELIARLADTGLSVIEVTSFVSAAWIPQLADAPEVMAALPQNNNIRFPVLVPNAQGLTNALAAGAKEVNIFAAASETFSQKNVNCSIEEEFTRFGEVLTLAQKHNIPVRAYLSCALGCPYEGEVPLKTVVRLAKRLLDLGCYEISLADTIGVGTPLQAQAMIEAVTKQIPIAKLAVHFHDTHGQALANIHACLGKRRTSNRQRCSRLRRLPLCQRRHGQRGIRRRA